MILNDFEHGFLTYIVPVHVHAERCGSANA